MTHSGHLSQVETFTWMCAVIADISHPNGRPFWRHACFRNAGQSSCAVCRVDATTTILMYAKPGIAQYRTKCQPANHVWSNETPVVSRIKHTLEKKHTTELSLATQQKTRRISCGRVHTPSKECRRLRFFFAPEITITVQRFRSVNGHDLFLLRS